ncbi:MAG: hypothetical protein ACE5I1_26070 [bacterium]
MIVRGAGEYEIIPYLLVQPEDVPQKMLDKLGRDVDMLATTYLNKPMRREGGRFVRRN